jgi:predicted nucleic acid-binding protein
MIVIADTSPLHYLILLEHADVLQHLYGRMIIPEAGATMDHQPVRMAANTANRRTSRPGAGGT